MEKQLINFAVSLNKKPNSVSSQEDTILRDIFFIDMPDTKIQRAHLPDTVDPKKAPYQTISLGILNQQRVNSANTVSYFIILL